MAEVVIRNNNVKVYVTQPSVLESVQVIQGPSGPQGLPGADGVDGTNGADGVVQSIVPGSNITVDSADPANPVVSASGGSAVATTFTPTGNIAATNVQAALAEVDSEKETPSGAQAKVTTHAAAADPHGDRAYVDGLLAYKGVRAYRASPAQSIPATTFTAVQLTGEDHDTGGWHDNATNNTRLTVPSGVTKVDAKAQIGFLANATGMRQVEIRKNGATVATANANAVSGFAAYVAVDVPGLTVAAGDYLEVFVWQNSGGALDVQDGAGYTWFIVRATH